MYIEGLIPFKSSMDQAIASLYFLRVSSNFCSSYIVNADDIITGLSFLVIREQTSNDLEIPSRLTLLKLFWFLLP